MLAGVEIAHQARKPSYTLDCEVNTRSEKIQVSPTFVVIEIC
jgi:hypothetical protein